MDDEELVRLMEQEFDKELDLAEVEDESRRVENKRKYDEDVQHGQEKNRKAKKRKLEKLVNWG